MQKDDGDHEEQARLAPSWGRVDDRSACTLARGRPAARIAGAHAEFLDAWDPAAFIAQDLLIAAGEHPLAWLPAPAAEAQEP